MNKQRGVLFNRDMVIASLTCAKCGKLSRPFPCEHCGSTEFVKQQTRRLCRRQPRTYSDGRAEIASIACLEASPPLGTAGDFLYCRETFCIGKICEEDVYGHAGNLYVGQCGNDTDFIPRQYTEQEGIDTEEVVWKPSIHMPKKYASIWFKITGVRVERINDISDDDAMAEGVDDTEAMSCCCSDGYRAIFSKLWEDCYGVGSWERNDHVFVYDIERCKKS